MATNILDTLALASIDGKAQIGRIAALWRVEFEEKPPYNKPEIDKWLRTEYKGLFDKRARARVTGELLLEIKRQIRLRRSRNKRDLAIDPATLPVGDGHRTGWLLNSRLGPARRWVSVTRTAQHESSAHYICGAVHSGLVAGLIPVKMRFSRISNPNMLVYRHRWEAPRFRYVPTHITTIEDAFIWLIPPAMAEFLRLPGTRVEHDGDEQTVRLITQFGTKTLPWRDLTSP